ncbi:MAG: DUF58 domain-containing protein [Bacteroidota bacterium]
MTDGERAGRTKGSKREGASAKPPARWRAALDLYAPTRLFAVLGTIVGLFVLGYWVPFVEGVTRLAVYGLVVAVLVDAVLLWRGGDRSGLALEREVPDKLSNGDPNPVAVRVVSRYPFPVRVRLIDEVPVQFQERTLDFRFPLMPGAAHTVDYAVRPVERGVYHFGAINAYVASPIGLLLRRIRAEADQEVKVYPSFLQMRRWAFLAESNRLAEVGVKRVRRIGHTMEFDQIREYVPGDDRRAINWKATARSGDLRHGGTLMVNQYQDERAQPIYAVIDMGRAMRDPFDGMTLVDHAINATLVLLNVALLKNDKAGLVTFDARMKTVLPASRRRTQLPRLLEALYAQQPGFQDPNFEALYATVRRQLPQRGLLLLFTNLQTRASLDRRLPLLRAIARQHRLVVVFFENTALRDLRGRPAERVSEVYVKTVAEQFAYEQEEVARTLQRHGIGALLTTPETLTVDTINRYLALKARGAI